MRYCPFRNYFFAAFYKHAPGLIHHFKVLIVLTEMMRRLLMIKIEIMQPAGHPQQDLTHHRNMGEMV